ncbi:MAG TPA: MEMAR_RS02690 family S-layer glycoprotein [Methanocorpusculum sp.]|nr:MEMAR_RS02690 family S-layer glycoprotein [Methanocorpusculum sp.]
MKNTTKTIAAVLAVFLAAALFVGAASAAEPGYRNVAENGTAFVYEQICVADANAATLVMLDSNGNPVNILTGSEVAENEYTYNLISTAIGSNYGRYYLDGDKANGYIDIWAPELVLKAELANDAGTSVDGKTVTKNTEITFSLQAPHVGPASGNATQNISTANANVDTILTNAETSVTAAQYNQIKSNITDVYNNLSSMYADDEVSSSGIKVKYDAIKNKEVDESVSASVVKGMIGAFNDAIYEFAADTDTKYEDELYPVVHLIFTTPAGGKTTYFGDKNYAAAFLSKNVETVVGSSNAGDDAQAGLYTVQAEYISPNLFDLYAKESNTVTFTVQSATLTVTAAQDSVIRSNPFTITISGEAKAQYCVEITNPETDDAKNPQLQPGQQGYYDENDEGYFFTTDASGNRVVQFNTYSDTEDKTFTIRVSEAEGTTVPTGADWDEVKIKVEKGAVTITASGDGSYYIGTEITLSGTNTDSDTVYLFITGPNLDSNGVKLLEVAEETPATDGGSQVSVKTDNTWEKKWNTAQTGLDTGAYTIYATSTSANKNSLSETEYATVSISLKQPFLSAVPSGTIIAKGDDLYIRGTAEGEPNELKIYIFGPNKFEPYSVNVEDDGTYEKKIKIDSNWASNQYFVVIQHPMYNGEFDADLNKEKGYFYIKNADDSDTNQASFYVTGQNKLQGSNAADALTKMIDNANIDDIYTKLTFTVTEPRIDINNPGDQGVGTKFTISGTTNLAVGDQIIVEVQSSSFEAVDKTSSSITDGTSMTTKVVAGEGTDNAWSVEVDTTNWKLDEYTIKATGIEVDVTATTNFNLVEKVVTPTATATGATPTTTATATATATATPATPGFGAFVALAGLGAVALLVLRRN